GPKSCSFIIPADNNNNGRKNITLPKFLNRDRLAKSKKSSIDNTKNDTVATATCITDTEDTGSSWLKHSSINSIISRWSEDLDQCNQTFQRQLEESHQLDQKMIEFNTGAANINVLVEKAKTIKYDICATLKEISSKQMAIDEFLSSMEKVFEGICLEDVNSYDYQRETNYKNFESVNQKINDMNCNLLTMINDTNTNILPSCNSNNFTDMMIDDPAANINVLVEKAKTIKYDICATLKEISSKQMAIDEFLSSMEKVFEGICLEDVNSYDYQRETNYKNFESVNQKINDMNCNLLTMINDTNTNILPSCNSNNFTDMMIDDPIDGLMDLFNSQLVSLEWIDSSAKHLSFLIQQAQDLLDNSQEDSLYNLTF
ncbi:21986_t:CDS:2, partial [Entrophospora sp. SA101]